MSRQAPDARADQFSLAAVLYTMLAGYGSTWAADVASYVEADPHLSEGRALTVLAYRA